MFDRAPDPDERPRKGHEFNLSGSVWPAGLTSNTRSEENLEKMPTVDGVVVPVHSHAPQTPRP